MDISVAPATRLPKMNSQDNIRIRKQAYPDSHCFVKLDPDPLTVKSWIRIRIKFDIQKLWRLKIEPWTLTMEAWRLKMEP